MIYNNELMHYKRTNFKHPKGLITFPPTVANRRQVSVFNRMMEQIKYFSKSIHGCSYVWQRDYRFTTRLFWLFVVIGSIITCVPMYLSLVNHHYKQQLRTVVASSQMPIYEINFPAIALCPSYHVNWFRRKAAEEKFIPPHADNNTKAAFHDVLRVLDDMNLSQLDSLALLDNQTVPSVIDKISLSDLANFLAFRCDELFVECAYAETKYDCCKIFVPERTEEGICMVFNSMVSEESRKKQISDKFYPWKNRKAGQGTGLQFTLQLNETYARHQSANPFVISVMVKDCEAWSESLTSCFLPNSKTYLSITPVIRETLASTRHLDPRIRKCLFAEEKSKYYDRIEDLRYNKLNCVVKCQQKNFIKICNCTLSWFFPKTDVRECTISDFKCIYKNRDIFGYIKSPLQDKYINDSRRGVTCDCVDSCYSVNVLTSFHANFLPNPNASNLIIQGDIYIGQRVLTKYETRLHSTLFDLIAQFGGILGLSLGASVLSLAEVVYTGLKISGLLLLTKLWQKRKIKPQTRKRTLNKN